MDYREIEIAWRSQSAVAGVRAIWRVGRRNCRGSARHAPRSRPIPMPAISWLPRVATAFRRERPHDRPRFLTRSSEEVRELAAASAFDLGICDSCQQRAAWRAASQPRRTSGVMSVTRSVIEGFLTGTRRAVNAVIHPNDHAATEPPISSLTRSGRPAAILGRWKKQWRHGAVGRYESPDPERPCHPAASSAARIFCGEIGRSGMRRPLAERTALAIAAIGGTIGTSPTPRAPNGCRGLGTSTSTASIIGTSEATGQR